MLVLFAPSVFSIVPRRLGGTESVIAQFLSHVAIPNIRGIQE